MATSGTYVTEVPLKGTAEKHYKRWRNENHAFPDAVGHHIQSVTVHDGEWDSHGAIKIWNYTLTNKQYVNLEKQEVFKERREIDDEKKTSLAADMDDHVIKA
ncbi:BnaC01g15490D [Brassica napus]|uniref:BnaC01g15490D protein n=1 Tax=Brassica napus TaxID=3708 RepID=A0A078IZY5_BRANA|nr:BnaC01g15490D [Brassica napus]